MTEKKAGGAQAPPGPTLTALAAINWILHREIPPGPDVDEAGRFNFESSDEDYAAAERALIDALAAEKITAEARAPAAGAGPLAIGAGPLVAVPALVFREPGVRLWPTGALCGRDGRAIFAGAQFRAAEICALWPALARQRAARVEQARVDAWIAEYFQRAADAGEPKPKRDVAIADCMNAIRATTRQAASAIEKVPSNLKRRRSRAGL